MMSFRRCNSMRVQHKLHKQDEARWHKFSNARRTSLPKSLLSNLSFHPIRKRSSTRHCCFWPGVRPFAVQARSFAFLACMFSTPTFFCTDWYTVLCRTRMNLFAATHCYLTYALNTWWDEGISIDILRYCIHDMELSFGYCGLHSFLLLEVYESDLLSSLVSLASTNISSVRV